MTTGIAQLMRKVASKCLNELEDYSIGKTRSDDPDYRSCLSVPRWFPRQRGRLTGARRRHPDAHLHPFGRSAVSLLQMDRRQQAALQRRIAQRRIVDAAGYALASRRRRQLVEDPCPVGRREGGGVAQASGSNVRLGAARFWSGGRRRHLLWEQCELDLSDHQTPRWEETEGNITHF